MIILPTDIWTKRFKLSVCVCVFFFFPGGCVFLSAFLVYAPLPTETIVFVQSSSYMNKETSCTALALAVLKDLSRLHGFNCKVFGWVPAVKGFGKVLATPAATANITLTIHIWKPITSLRPFKTCLLWL